jgi:mannosyltransferase OCH1-like enzyme
MNKNQSNFKSSNKLFLFILILVIIIIIICLIYYKYFNHIENFNNNNNDNNTNINKNTIIFDNTNIDKNINNIFLFWEGDINENRLSILITVIKSTYYYNKDKPIYLFSNSLKEDKIIDILNICKLVRYSYNNLIKNTPIENKEKIKLAYEKIQNDGRMFCDFFRFIVLYKFGGTYTDTDNICIKKLPVEKNIICRTYDPHTAFYDKISDDDCVPGEYKYNQQFTDIKFGIRTDCWLNFEPQDELLYLLINSDKLIDDKNNVLYITHENGSWQGLLLVTIRDNIKELTKNNKHKYILGLNLLYLYEKFIAHSSKWDKCEFGGELCSLYDGLPNLKDFDWGDYKTDKNTALEFLEKCKAYFPTCCFLWMGDKESNEELFIKNDNDTTDKKRLSTWIYKDIENKSKNVNNLSNNATNNTTNNINTIPKIIHQIYWDFTFKNRDIEVLFGEHYKKVKLIYNDWEYRLWNKDDCITFLTNNYPKYLDYFNLLNIEIKKHDFIRILIIYHYGGMYLDLDIMPISKININNFIDYDIYFSSESPEPVPTNCFILSKSKQEFFINYANYVMTLSMDLGAVAHTGPGALVEFYKEYNSKYKIKMLDYKLLTPINYHQKDELKYCRYNDCSNKYPESYFIHMYNGSWL